MMEEKIASLLGERLLGSSSSASSSSSAFATERYNGVKMKNVRWAMEAHKHTEKGDFESGLYYLNLCLSNVEDEGGLGSNHVNGVSEDGDISPSQQQQQLPQSEILSLLEKRCLVHMKMKNYEKAVMDAQSLIQQQCNHTLAYKCLLAALCKLNQLKKVSDILRVWKLASPNNLEMIECRTKLEGLIQAVSHGIDARQAFSNVEEILGLNYEWLLKRKNDSRWKYRPLPPGKNTFVLCLQYRFGHCSLGQKCPDAHGEHELDEWKERATIENDLVVEEPVVPKKSAVIQRLTERISQVDNESVVLTEENFPSGLKIKCLEPLKITLSSRKMKSYKWTFAVESKLPLVSVCLLHEIHRQYFKISSACFHESGTRVNLMPQEKEQKTVQEIEVNLDEDYISSGSKSHAYMYSVTVVFTPELLGKFRQTVVFDFGYEPKPIRNIGAEVYPPSEDEASAVNDSATEIEVQPPKLSEDEGLITKRKTGTWNFGNAEIVNGTTGDRVPSENLGFALINGVVKHTVVSDSKEVLTRHNYKEKMRFFLTEEERARQEIISKYNVSAVLKITDQYAMTSGYFEGEIKYAVDGGLYGRMTLFRDISEDTAVGRLILRSCRTVLLTKTETAQQSVGKPRVYWCEISDKTKNAIYIQLGGFCVRDMGLKRDDAILFDIQFQLDRTAFMEQKEVIDRLSDVHLDMLFPDFSKNLHIPWSPIMQWDGSEKYAHRKLNPKQREALIAVTSEGAGLPPILLIGPFGTGKTYTLAQCIRKILTQPTSRVMICTQSNSAADLYIKEYLDKWCEEEGFEAGRPLRIYYAFRSFKTVHPNVLKYCITDKYAGKFRNPTKEDILAHRVIVVTLGSSYLLMDLDLPSDTFSHIFLDEAAQAMESEAITPLLSAGETTKLVLAGDHMQLSPELFCEHAKNFHSSLLERLHYDYPESHPCKLMLCENYRSHAAIIQFASESFYNRKLECGMNQPAHQKLYPLSFFAARGEDVQEEDSTSYFNMAEVFEVTEKVSEIISSWPESWGNWKDESAIGVLTPYADQVSKIRARLRKKGMTHVSVERVLNVQGKQFRAVLLSTVRTHKPWVRILPEAVGKEVDFGFFSNPKLLNTALTRAQSLVAVVGDPVSLCSVGKCRVLWEDFIRVCHENKSLHGISYMQLKQNILGVEMIATWGLNPLANEFKPKNGTVVVSSAVANTQHQGAHETTVPDNQTAYYSPSKVSEVLPTIPPVSAPYLPSSSSERYVNICPPAANGIIPTAVPVPPPIPPAHPSQVGYRPVVLPQQQPMMRPYPTSHPAYAAGAIHPGILSQRYAALLISSPTPYGPPIPVPHPGPVRTFGPGGVPTPYTAGFSGPPPPPFHGPPVGPIPPPFPPEMVHGGNMRPQQPPPNYQQGPCGPVDGARMPMHPAAGAPLYRRPAETVPNPKTSPYLQQPPTELTSHNVAKGTAVTPLADSLSPEDLLVLQTALEKYSQNSDAARENEKIRILRSKLGLSVSDTYRCSPGSGALYGSNSSSVSVPFPLEPNLATTTTDYPRLKSQDSLPPTHPNATNQLCSSNGISHPEPSSYGVTTKPHPNPWFTDSGFNYSNLDSRISSSMSNHSYASSTEQQQQQNAFRVIPNQPWNEPSSSSASYSQLSDSQLEGSRSSNNAIGGRSYANVVKQATAPQQPSAPQQQLLNNNGPEVDPFLKYKLHHQQQQQLQQQQQQQPAQSQQQVMFYQPPVQNVSSTYSYRSPQR